MCGTAEANSAEHRLKKSDIERAYGRGSYQRDAAPVHVRNGIISKKYIQGSDSDILKYEKIICRRCNDTISQPFDRAYDAFIAWLLKNEFDILKYHFINFAEAFGSDFETSQRNLYKYSGL